MRRRHYEIHQNSYHYAAGHGDPVHRHFYGGALWLEGFRLPRLRGSGHYIRGRERKHRHDQGLLSRLLPGGLLRLLHRGTGRQAVCGLPFQRGIRHFETGDFHVAIPVEGEIDEVILKTGAGETSIWKKEAAAPDDGSSHDTAATEAPTEVPTAAAPALTLPILDDIDENVIPGISGSSLRAVQVAVRLLDWGVNTGLGADEIGEAAAAWLAAKGDDQALCVEKLELVDYAYQELLTDEADDLLDVAGCADIHRFWGSEPVESIEAIMQAAGLRG